MSENQQNSLLQKNALLLLEDGSVFIGKAVGADSITTGEICFNTSLTGYQEIITDPSYYQQIICFTFPHIGNVGTNENDYENKNIGAVGVIIGADITIDSNFRSQGDFNNWLVKKGVSGISNVDTRAITAHIRDNGAQNCLICHYSDFSELDIEELQKTLQKSPKMAGLDLASKVSTQVVYTHNLGEFNLEQNDYITRDDFNYTVVVLDFGVKKNILNNLVKRSCETIVVPYNTSLEKILAYNPNGIFLSNGPGDPAATYEKVGETIKQLTETDIPIFGICLGHQILAKALGCTTSKMKQGHRGANHPVKNLSTGKVEITSQNHGFAVERVNMAENVEETHISLFDNSNEGIAVKGKNIFSVQHHPEASPGPQDSEYVFDKFVACF